jgi:hypothetical protein
MVNDPEAVTTDQGTWATFDSSGVQIDSGTFEVTGLVKFDPAPGTAADPSIRAGLAFLRIAYSDGSDGILVASCHLSGTPPSVSEGYTVSKGNTIYGDGFKGAAFFTALD